MTRIRGVHLLAAASAILFVIGGLATFSTFAWTVDREYIVSVSAPEGLAWTLWVPHPGVHIPWTSRGAIASVGEDESPAGLLLNITGTGAAQVSFSTTTVGLDPDPFRIGSQLNLTGRQGQGWNATYRVWRQSPDPSANISLSGGHFLDATRLDESWEAGMSGFAGYPAEGWNDIPARPYDGVHMISSIPGLIPAALPVPGAVLAVLAWRRRSQGP